MTGEVAAALAWEGRQAERSRVVEAPLPGGAAPVDAQYVVMALDGTLPNERKLTSVPNGITVVDGGAGGNVTLALPQDLYTGASPTFAAITIPGTTTLRGVAYTWPAADAAASGYVLSSDGAGNLSWVAQSGGISGSGAAGQVTYFDGATSVTGSANLTFDGTKLTAAGIIDSALTSGRVVYATTGGELTDSAAFTFNGTQLALSTTGSSGGLLAGGDALWYRGAADVWRTPDSLVVDASGSFGGGAAAVASAILELTSTSRGFLPPRMTEAQRDAIGSPAEGLVVYNTDTELLNLRDSGAWVAIDAGGLSGSGASGRVAFWTGASTLSSSVAFTFDSGTGALAVTTSAGTVYAVNAVGNFTGTQPALAVTQASTGDAALRFALDTTASYAVGIDNSDSDKFKIAYAASGSAALGTGDLVWLTTAGDFGLGITPASILHTGTNDANKRFAYIDLYAADANSPQMTGRKSRNTTVGSHSDLSANDGVAAFVAQSSVSSAWVPSGFIRWRADAGGTSAATHAQIFNHNGSSLFEVIRMQANGNIGIGTSSTPSGGGTPALVLAQASGNPTGMGSNTAGIFAKDVAGTCELFGVDEGGAVTQLTPHSQAGPPELYDNRGLLRDIVIHDVEQYTGGERFTNLTRLARAVEWLLAELRAMGRAVPADLLPLVVERKRAEMLDWETEQAAQAARRQSELDWWDGLTQAERQEQGPRPKPLAAKPMPAWMRTARERAARLPVGPVDIGRLN